MQVWNSGDSTFKNNDSHHGIQARIRFRSGKPIGFRGQRRNELPRNLLVLSISESGIMQIPPQMPVTWGCHQIPPKSQSMSNQSTRGERNSRFKTMPYRSHRWYVTAGCSLALLVAVAGCGGGSVKPNPSTTTKASTANSTTDAGSPADSKASPQPAPKPKFEAVTLGGETSKPVVSASEGASEKQQMETVVAAMQPLQVMLGKWRGTTNKEFKGFKAVEESEWIWDFKTNRAQPALTVKSDKSPYIREGRLTFLPAEQKFQFTATTPEGVQHVMTGTFEREPEEFTGDDNKPQKSYKLKLSEVEPNAPDAWQVAFDQQENNRYLVQVSRKSGSNFQLIDTVGTQRMGTSVAANDEDYGERKCIISGGLGTSTVSYGGKTYWVCCSGCQAAFNDDPKRWLAKMAEADKAKKPN